MGKMISLSLIHGGPGPSFFSQSIVDYLFHGLVAVRPTIGEIPDPAIQELMQKVFLQLVFHLHCIYMLQVAGD